MNPIAITKEKKRSPKFAHKATPQQHRPPSRSQVFEVQFT